MKYIVFKRKIGKSEQFVPIMFPNYLVHAEVAAALAPILGKQIHSAGEFSSTALCDTEFHGSSSTLQTKAAEDDNALIGMHDYWQGYK